MLVREEDNKNNQGKVQLDAKTIKLERLKKQIDDASDLARDIEKLMLSYPYQVRIRALRSVSATLGMQVMGFNQPLTMFNPTNSIAKQLVPQSPVAGKSVPRIEEPKTNNLSWKKTQTGKKLEKQIIKFAKLLTSTPQGTPEFEDLQEKFNFLKAKKEEYKLYLSGLTTINDGSNRQTSKKKNRGRKDPLSSLQYKEDGSLIWSSINYRNYRAYVNRDKDSKEEEISQVSGELGEHSSQGTTTNNKS